MTDTALPRSRGAIWPAWLGALVVLGLGLVGALGLSPSSLPPSNGSLTSFWYASSVEFSILFLSAATSELLFGTSVGLLAAYGPLALHALLQRASELVSALPLFVYLTVFRLSTGGEPFWAFASVICVCRVLVAAERTRSSILGLEQNAFSVASRALGSSRRQRFVHHFAPHVLTANLEQLIRLPAFLVGLEACLEMVGTSARWSSWGATLVNDGATLFSGERLLSLASLVATGAWAAHATYVLPEIVKNHPARLGNPGGPLPGAIS